jgi:cysteinyl-tRNA synthetase
MTKKSTRDVHEEELIQLLEMAYADAVKNKDYELCDKLREELRKIIIGNAKPWFSVKEDLFDK